MRSVVYATCFAVGLLGGVLLTVWTGCRAPHARIDGGAKREAEPRAGGLVICFGCRRSYHRDPVAATWHVEFCPKCAPEDDPRWTDSAKQLWAALNRKLGRDVKKDIEWEAL